MFTTSLKAMCIWVVRSPSTPVPKRSHSGTKGRSGPATRPASSSAYHKIDTNDQSTFFDPSQESLPEGPIYGHGDWLNDTSQSDWKKIVIPIEYRSDEKPNYLMVTASASYRGDYMEGNKESRMYIDDIEFVY